MSKHGAAKSRLQQEVQTLAFITRAGNWLFLLMSRIAEPLLFLCTLYVIAVTVLPTLFKTPMLTGISNVSILILNIAPEVILPGCFLQAAQADEQQRWMYKAMGWVFILLTFVTLASFIWQFSSAVVSVILFFRCAAGVLFSLLVRMTPHNGEDMISLTDHENQMDELSKRFKEQVQQLISLNTQQLCDELPALVQSATSGQVHEGQKSLLGQVQTIIQEQRQSRDHGPSEQVLQSLLGQVQEMSSALGTLGVAVAKIQTTRSTPVVQKQADIVPLKVVQATKQNEQSDSPGARVTRYLQEQIGQGHTPTLREIMETCECSKGTAIRYRQQVLGDDEQAVNE